MCGRFTLWTPADDVVTYFGVNIPVEWQMALRFNIAPTQQVAVVRAVDQGRELIAMRWGLIPSWAKDAKIGASMIMPTLRLLVSALLADYNQAEMNGCNTRIERLLEGIPAIYLTRNHVQIET